MNVFHLPEHLAYLRYHDLPGPDIPLLLIHGFGCASSCDFPRVVTDPALERRRCLLVDLLGSGFSDRPSGFSYAMDAHARCLLQLLDTLEIPSIDLYGHSMGGAVAIELATLQPGRIRRFVASEPSLDAGNGPFSSHAAGHSESDYVTRGFDEAVAMAVQDGNPIWAGTLAASSPIAIHREAKALGRGASPSWRERLHALPMPRTVLFGERSLPHPDLERLAGAGIVAAGIGVAGIGVDVVPGAGHSMMWENPSGLARAIQRALA